MVRMVPSNKFKPFSNFLTDRSKAVMHRLGAVSAKITEGNLFYLCFVFFCHNVLSVPYSPVITCWESAKLMALLYEMFYCVLSLFHMHSRVSYAT